MLGPQHTASTHTVNFGKVVTKVFARRPSANRRRMQNATFSGTASPPASGASPQREFSQTFCCTPPPLTQAPLPLMHPLPNSSVLLESPSTRSSSSSSDRSSTTLTLNLRVQGWMYWARPDGIHDVRASRRRRSDPEAGKCFTKVYAVLRNEFLLLYRSQHKFARYSAATEDPLVHIAVAKATSMGGGQFLVEDPQGERMVLHVFERQDEAMVEMWKESFAQAVELTSAHFAQFSITAENLPRNSMFRGSLQDLRESKPRLSLRGSLTDRFSKLGSFRRFSSLPSLRAPLADEPEREISN